MRSRTVFTIEVDLDTVDESLPKDTTYREYLNRVIDMAITHAATNLDLKEDYFREHTTGKVLVHYKFQSIDLGLEYDHLQPIPATPKLRLIETIDE